jgi:hypothetical protein
MKENTNFNTMRTPVNVENWCVHLKDFYNFYVHQKGLRTP